MTWEHGRQLAGMSKSGSTLSFGYDADGVRISKTVNGVETKYYTASDQILRMEKGEDVLDFIYDEAGMVFSVIHNGTPYYYVRNGQNDIVALVDQNANIIGQYSYDAWGKPLQTTGDAEIVSLNPFRYRGYVYDEETGLYYLQSRYYDPEIGRYLNADAIAGVVGELGTHNVFAYCSNNPANMLDPSGHFALTVSLAVPVLIAVGKAIAVTGASIAAWGIGSTLGKELSSFYNNGVNTAKKIREKVESKSYDESQWKQNNVYVLRDNNGDVRYVGRSNNPKKRMAQHQMDKLHPERKDYKMDVVAVNLTLRQSRFVEQTIIHAYSVVYLDNARNEISRLNVPGYFNEMDKLVELLESIPEDELKDFLQWDWGE